MIVLSRSKNPSHRSLAKRFRQAVPIGGTVFYPWLREVIGTTNIRTFLIVAATNRLHLRLVHTIERDPK